VLSFFEDMSFATTNPGVAGTDGSDNMDNIAEIIRTDPSMRQTFIDIATQRDPALGQQLTQNLRLLDIVSTQTAGPQGVHGQFAVTREEEEAIQRLTDLGFEEKQALVAYLVSDKNEEHATKYLVKNRSKNKPMDPNNPKATKTPAFGQLISDNPSFRLGLNEFIAREDPALAQQTKENPALIEEALQSATVGGGDGLSGRSSTFTMSSDLQWFLLRKHNSYMVKRVPEGPVFSREPGNLLNLHSYKYSGLANTKTIDIRDSGSGVQITTRKTKASPRAVRTSKVTSTLRNGSGGRRSLGITASYAKRGYRSDLRKAALGRTSALLAAQKEPKPTPERKVRGKKPRVIEESA